MKRKRYSALFIVLAVSLISISSGLPLSLLCTSVSAGTISGVPQSYLIENVPYVGQKTNFHCAFASQTMIFQYFGINTSLDEVIYSSGNAYSLYYPEPSKNHLPIGGYLISQLPLDLKFLADIYGLSFSIWWAGNGLEIKDEYWNEYWIRIKQNISDNIPISTSVDPFDLPSIRNQFDPTDTFWNKRDGGHGIVLIGFNETNESICYNDPGAGYFGNPEYGTYDWMNLTDFKRAVESTSGTKYLISRFQKIADPQPMLKIIEKSYVRNIEKLKGNESVYDKLYIDNSSACRFGINASKALKEDYEKGIQNRIKTLVTYKLHGRFGIKFQLTKFICSYFPWVFDKTFFNCEIRLQNEFDRIAIEKRIAADVLLNNSDISNICEYGATLLRQEAENWTKISEYYNVFMKKGIFLSLPRALLLMNKMADTMDNIIAIEEAIIAGP